ncbi:MAG: hypothetical protein U5O39_16435 [Gammaproteobacteria bacterium]|nr:hypothetical protein [Gammaproteobacteria bacterium]
MDAGANPPPEATATLCQRLGVESALVPMTDNAVPTIVKLADGGTLSFQHYFVRDRCAPVVSGFEFQDIDSAKPSPGFASVFGLDPELSAIIICSLQSVR